MVGNMKIDALEKTDSPTFTERMFSERDNIKFLCGWSAFSNSMMFILAVNFSALVYLYVDSSFSGFLFIIFISILLTSIIGIYISYVAITFYFRYKKWFTEYLALLYELKTDTLPLVGKTTTEKFINILIAVFPEIKYAYIKKKTIVEYDVEYKDKKRKVVVDAFINESNFIIFNLETEIIDIKRFNKVFNDVKFISKMENDPILRLIILGKEFDEKLIDLAKSGNLPFGCPMTDFIRVHEKGFDVKLISPV
jgi:hypothetical protein